MYDVVEYFYKNLHSSGDLYDFPAGIWYPTTIGKISYDNFAVSYEEPFVIDGRTVFSASIKFDAVTMRSG
jgi:hypothetical protein